MSTGKYVQDEVEVVSIGYKIAHGLNIVLFTILAITGALLLFEPLQIFAYIIGAPLAPLLNTTPVSAGVELARISHRFIGVLWGVFLVVYGIYLVAFRRITVFKALRKPLSLQIREAKAIMDHYIFGKPIPKDVEKELHRHNVLVAYMVLLLVVGIALLSISGVLLMFENNVQVTRVLLLLHNLGFYMSLIFLMAHLFASTHLSNRPLLLAMFGYGRVPLDWAKKHMAKYLHERGVS